MRSEQRLPSTVRELFTYTLHVLAPEEEVRRCEWFVQQDGTNKITRRQRLSYAIHGGLPPEYVENELLLGPDVMADTVLGVFDELHKLTHVRPDTLVTDKEIINAHGQRTIATLSEFLENIMTCGTAVAGALEDKIHDAVYEAIAVETLPELDELASHYTIEDHCLDAVEVAHIDSEWVRLKVKATVTVGLQWGSNSDIRNDMGALGEESFPLTVMLKAPVSDPTSVESDEEGPVAVDTSSWFDNYYEPIEDFNDGANNATFEDI